MLSSSTPAWNFYVPELDTPAFVIIVWCRVSRDSTCFLYFTFFNDVLRNSTTSQKHNSIPTREREREDVWINIFRAVEIIFSGSCSNSTTVDRTLPIFYKPKTNYRYWQRNLLHEKTWLKLKLLWPNLLIEKSKEKKRQGIEIDFCCICIFGCHYLFEWHLCGLLLSGVRHTFSF